MANPNEQSQGQTKKCPKCREDVQSGAKKCKHCGADLRNWFVQHKVITGILILLAIGIVGSAMGGGTTSTTTSPSTTKKAEEVKKEEVITISAQELYTKYEANEIQADDLYKNKLLEVSGSVDSIGKDILDNPYVTLKTDAMLGNIQCMLADSEKAKASGLSKGQSISITGRNTGKTILSVLLRDCKLQ